jgi:acyl dehydratase
VGAPASRRRTRGAGARLHLKLAATIVGEQAGPLEHRLDSRWVMAYNAGLGERSDAVHPLFPVCYEWPVSDAIRALPGLKPMAGLLVHAQHDLVIHRPLKAGETVSCTVRIVAAEPRSPGAFVVYRFEARDANGKLVTVTDFGALYRGVELDRAAGEPVKDPPPLQAKLEPTGKIAIAATAAHVYTECARIWNPIHTDVAYARAAGLPDIILHGTATLAYSISSLLKTFNIEAGAVRRVACRFAGMVLMPSTLSVHAAREGAMLQFETRTGRGDIVISRGRLLLE